MVSRLESDGNRGSTIAGYVKSLKGWWLFNDIEVTRPVRLAGTRGCTTMSASPPTRNFTPYSSTPTCRRGSPALSWRFPASDRGCLGNRDADDGLRISDLPEMVIKKATRARTASSF